MNLKVVAALLLGCAPLSAIAADHDFNDAVSSIKHTYHLHRRYVPFIRLASFGAHVATGGAVQGMRIAVFDEKKRLPAGADMPGLLKGALGSSWSLVVESISKDISPATANAGARRASEQDAIFAHPHGERMTLLVATYDDEGLSLVRVDLNAAQFAQWLQDPTRHARPTE